MKGLFEGTFRTGRWVRPPDLPAGPETPGRAVAEAAGRAAAAAIRAFASEAQRGRWLPVIDRDPTRASYAFHEDGAGADAAAVAAAFADGRVTGRKTLVANAETAEVLVVLCRTAAHARISAAIVPRDRETEVGARTTCAGLGGFALHEIDMRGAPAEILGAEGEGFRVAETVLAHGRCATASAAARAHRAALEAARSAATRVRFDRPLAEHEAVSDALDEAGLDLLTAEAAAADAGARLEAGDGALEAAAAKVWACAALRDAARLALRTAGGAGYVAPAPLVGALVDAEGLGLAFGDEGVLRAYVSLVGVEGVRSYLRETDSAMRSVYGFARLWPLYAVRRARLALGRPRWREVPPALREAAAQVEEAAGILAFRAFDLAFRRRGLLARSGRIQQHVGRIAVEIHAAAAAVARCDADSESTAWRIAARAFDRVARESRDLETALVVAEDDGA